MRQFIREHPWQLEIVPALAVVMNIGAALFYYLRLAGDPFMTEVRSTGRVPMGSFFAMLIGYIMLWWALEFTWNHKWVIAETRKRFNWPALVCQATILLWSWTAPFMVYIDFRLATDNAHISVADAMSTLTGGILLIGLGTTALLEWRRPYIPREETPEPPPPASDSEDSYIDAETDRSWFVFSFFLTVMSVLAAVSGRYWPHGIIGLLAAILFVSFAYRKVAISPEGVAFSCGPIRKRFAIADIVECRPLRQELWAWNRLGKTRTFSVTTGRSLELKLKNGMTYRLGMVRPSYACELLERAASQREP